VWDDAPPERHGPLIYCKDIAAYRAAWEAAQQRAAEWAAWKADPEAQAELAKPDEASRTGPPWEAEGYEPTLIPDQEERTRRRLLMRERINWTPREPKPAWFRKFNRLQERPPIPSMKKLKDARKKMMKLAEVVRDEAFNYWLDQWVKPAQRPDEWTQASVLYENYLKRAKEYGNNKGDKRLSKDERATETQWGKMMGSLYQKKRRAGGNYYPVKLNRGA
jgi:hypothetical protein